MLIYKSVTIEQVLKLDIFKNTSIIAGENGLDKEIVWIHPLDIWDSPDKWIDGGELIFCCTWINDPMEILPFFRELMPLNISGFCIQLHTHSVKIPLEMIDLANENQCPFIVFHQSVRFIDIAKDLLNLIIKNVNYDYINEKAIIESNEWMKYWVNGEYNRQEIAKCLNIPEKELNKYHYIAIVAEYIQNNINLPWSESIYFNISKALRDLYKQNNFILHSFFYNGMLTGIIFDFGSAKTWKARFSKVSEDINQYSKLSGNGPSILITAGNRKRNPEEIKSSYQNALDTMHICQLFHLNKTIYEDLNYYSLLSFITNKQEFLKFKSYTYEQISPLKEEGKNPSRLLDTFEIYYKNNGNKQLTANELNITRPTLYDRLEQIEDILGGNLLDHEIKLNMEIALAFYKILN